MQLLKGFVLINPKSKVTTISKDTKLKVIQIATMIHQFPKPLALQHLESVVFFLISILLTSLRTIPIPLNNSSNFVRIQNFNPVAIRILNKCQAFHFTIVRFLHKFDSQFFKSFAGAVYIRNGDSNVTKSSRV